MAGKKPKNKYDPLEGLSPEEKRQIEQQRNIFGLSSQEPQETTELETKANNVMVELDESSLDTPEIIAEDNADDIGEPFGDVTYENIFNHTPINNNAKTEKKDTRKGSKTVSVDNDSSLEDILPEDVGDILEEIPTPTSSIDEAISDAVSKFRETTDGGLNRTVDDVAYDEERTRELREIDAQNNAITQEAIKKAEEEAMKALEEALDAQEALNNLAEGVDDVSGQEGKGKKKKGKSAGRRLKNNTPNASVLETNFPKPETSASRTSAPSQEGLNKNSTPPVVPSGYTPEGKSGVEKKSDQIIIDTPPQQPIKTEEPPKENPSSKKEAPQETGVSANNPIENNPTVNSGVSPLQQNTTPYSDTLHKPSDDPKSPVYETPYYEENKKQVYNNPVNETVIYSGIHESPKEKVEPPTNNPTGKTDSGIIPPEKNKPTERVDSGVKPPEISKIDSSVKPPEVSKPVERVDSIKPPEVSKVDSIKPPEVSKVDSGVKPPEVSNLGRKIDSDTKQPEPSDYTKIPPVAGSGGNGSYTNSPFIYDFKTELEKHIQGGSSVKVFETGTHITVQCDNFTTSIPKAEGIKPMPVGVESTSLAFNKLVRTLYDAQPEKPAVYDTSDVFTTEAIRTPPPEDKVTPKKSFWDIDTLNKSIQETYGSTAILSPTNNPNTYTIYGGTEHEANITLHPVSHRVVDVIYKSDNPSKATKDNIEAIKNTTKSYAELCRSTESAYERLESRKANLGQQAYSSGSAKKGLPQSIPGVTNKPIGNATQLSMITPAFYAASNFGSISTPYATAPINAYRTYMTSGAVATRLRTMYTMHLPESILSTHTLPLNQVGRDLLINMLKGENALASLADEDVILSGQLGNTPNVQIHGTTGTNINDTTSRAVKNIDEANNIIPNRIYSGINSGYNLTPYHPAPNFKPLLNTTRGLALMAAIQLRQKAMQNPVGEGAQQVATYTILPFQMLYKPKPERLLAGGLKYLPSYNTAVTQYVKELRSIGIKTVDAPSLFQIATVRNELNRTARALGFDPARLNQAKIAVELKIRLDWLKNPSSIPAGKSVELIQKEINVLKALSSANNLQLTKCNMTSYYVQFFKDNGLNIPDSITNLTNRTQFAMLRSIVERDIGAKYGIDDITNLSIVRLEGLMQKHNFTDKELNILKLFAKPEMSRFSRMMQKADRRAMYFMLFLQRAMGQNETVTGAVKAYRWVRSVRMIIHYTRRINSIAQRMLSRLAHKKGWDKLIARNRSLSKFGRGVKKVPKKAVKGIGKGIKKGGKFASKHLAKTAVGRGTKVLTKKISSSLIGRATKGSIKFVSQTATRISAKMSAIAAKKVAIEASITQSIGNAFGFGSGSAVAGGASVAGGAGTGTVVAEGAGAAGAGGATAGGIGALGWLIIVLVIILVLFILYVTVAPVVEQGLDAERETKTFNTIFEELTKLDKGYIKGMKDVKIDSLEETGDSKFVYTINEDEQERFDITGYYDPNEQGVATLTEWGWGEDAKNANSIPDKNTRSTLVRSFKNTLYEVHNRGGTFTFTDSPKTIYYLDQANHINVSNKFNTPPEFTEVENTNQKQVSFTSNAKEMLALISVITNPDRTQSYGYNDEVMTQDYSELMKAYAYKGVKINTASSAFAEGAEMVSLWTATHGYQTSVSDIYACNGCKDFSYECNSQEWKELNNNNDFKFNKSTLTHLSGNEKALPYNEKGCYQHKTQRTVTEKSNKEYYCGGYHKTSTGKYIKCVQANSNYSAVGHLYTDIYGTETLTGHKENVCKHYDLVPAGSKTVNESCYIQDKQYYNHNCPEFNVSNCQDVVNVSDLFGTTAYFISFNDEYTNRFNTPSCASVSNPFFVLNNSTNQASCYYLIYCTGHHNCNTNTVDKDLDPVRKDTSVTLYYEGNTHSFYMYEDNYQNAVSSALFTINVYDYCTHYKNSTKQVTYDLSKKVCNGHCDGHTKSNGDHPCVYCIGHKDKLVSAYVISETNPEAVPSKIRDSEYGYWDCLPFNTIYSADTCSGPAAFARDGYITGINGAYRPIIDTELGIIRDNAADWFLSLFDHNQWYYDKSILEGLDDPENRDEIAIASADYLRQEVANKMLISWNDTYSADIFPKITKSFGGSEYVGYINSSLSTEWDYIEYQLLKRDTTEQQKEFVKWAVSSCGRVPYYPSGRITAKWYSNGTNENVNNFGVVTNEDEAGRTLKGVNESKWLNWCYLSAFSTNCITHPDGVREYIDISSTTPNSNSVQLNSIDLNTDYNITPSGWSNAPQNTKRIVYDTEAKLENGVRAGDIILLKKKCPLCGKMFRQGYDKTNCNDCDIALTQDFAIVVGWADYAKSECKNPSCEEYEEKFKNIKDCPSCGQTLEKSYKTRGDDVFVIEMSSDACEENVVFKRYDENAFDISNSGVDNKYVVYRFLN